MRTSDNFLVIITFILIVIMAVLSFMAGLQYHKPPPINNYDITVIVPATTVPPTVKPIPVY